VPNERVQLSYEIIRRARKVNIKYHEISYVE